VIALSIRQPWAHRILCEGKDVENRTWPIPLKYRGRRVLIHAGLRPDMAERKRCAFPDAELPLGGIVGVVTLRGCVQDSLSPWAEPGCFHWLLADARPLRFFPCKGFLGFFTVAYPYEVPS
jgi:hypothetical protein